MRLGALDLADSLKADFEKRPAAPSVRRGPTYYIRPLPVKDNRRIVFGRPPRRQPCISAGSHASSSAPDGGAARAATHHGR
jgi:hypothetical protein